MNRCNEAPPCRIVFQIVEYVNLPQCMLSLVSCKKVTPARLTEVKEGILESGGKEKLSAPYCKVPLKIP